MIDEERIEESWGRDAEPPAIGQVLAYLRPGDIVTHMFTAHPGGLLDPNGKLWAGVREAAIPVYSSTSDTGCTI